MKSKWCSEEQIVYALRQAESGEKLVDICRKLGVNEQTFYAWWKKYAGMSVLELRERRQLRVENRKLKQLIHSGPQASAPNERWSMDFMADRLVDGRAFRVLTVVDQFSREYPLYDGGPFAEWQEGSGRIGSVSPRAGLTRSHHGGKRL